jgi:hypothetical protein
MKLETITLDTNVIPIYSNINFEIFQSKYIAVKKHKCKKSYSYILNKILPTFLVWQACYENRNYYKDITFYTLLRLLEADDGTPFTLEKKFSLLDTYLKNNNMSFLDICIEAFILHLNKKAHIPASRYKKEKKFWFYIVNEIKMFIFSIIRKYILEVNRDLLYRATEEIDYFIIEPFKYIDLSIPDNFDGDDLKMYLYNKLTYYKPSVENKNFKYTSNLSEKRDNLCLLIKQMQSSN